MMPKALAIIVALVLLLLIPFASLSTDDVACVAVVVDGAASIYVSLSASLALVLTKRLPTDSGPTGRKGSVAFLVVLDSCFHHHRFDPSDNWCGGVVLGQHGIDHFTEHLGNDDVLLRSGEDVLVSHLCLQDFFLDTPTPRTHKALRGGPSFQCCSPSALGSW